MRTRQPAHVLLLFEMANGPLPIGSLHVRDFAPLRTQRPLSDLTADADGYIRFACLKCPRQGKVALAKLRERFQPTEGLVNILNTLAPTDCQHGGVDAWGNHACGFCYRDLGRPRDD
jgi:hypothetical protein